MERIVGDPVSSAMWATEVLESEEFWGRLQRIIQECLYVGDSSLDEGNAHLTWLADTLEVRASLNETSPLRQLKFEVRVFDGFEDDEDGWYLASNLNHSASGGAYVYDAKSKSLDFVSYCALATWFDLALLLYAVRTAIGQCEVLSGREDMLSYSKCKSAARCELKVDGSDSANSAVVQRLWDMAQPDYIAGIWLSDLERVGVLERIAAECPWVSMQSDDSDGNPKRVIEGMKFEYHVSPDDVYLSVFNNFSSLAYVSANLWTNFGRAIVTAVTLPFFTHSGISDDGASELEAVRLANSLNRVASMTCWQKLGVGSWFAKGSQICFASRVPHSHLKPIVMGTNTPDIADVVFDIINPNMTRRLVSIVARELRSIGKATQRDPESMDSMPALIRLITKPDLVRVENGELLRVDDEFVSWTFPSTPLLVYGVFNPVGSTMGSVELVHMRRRTFIVSRYRHPSNPGQVILAAVDPERELSGSIVEAVQVLCDHISPPDFISIPSDLREDLRDSVIEGLMLMSESFGKAGIDMTQRGLAIRNQPNPWWRGPNGNDNVFEMPPELEGFTPAEVYLSQALQISIADYNFGLFQSWWEGALAFLRDPNNPDEATRVVEAFTDHTLARLKGSGN